MHKAAFTTLCIAGFLIAFSTTPVNAEEAYEDSPYSTDINQPEAPPAKPMLVPKQQAPAQGQSQGQGRDQRRKYFVPDTERVDAGIFHVAFAAGGNFYLEPKLDAVTREPDGEYFKDFGFQAGVFFDYDYSSLNENIPLGLRGMVGYKYILSSVHVFTFDGVVRYMFRVSDRTTFGLGLGGSAAVWYRSITDTSPDEEVIFLPSFIVGGGFEFNPFMVDFKWLINRLGGDATIMGFELYFGVRL